MRAMSEQYMQSPSEPSLEVKASLAQSYTPPTRTNSRQTASKLLQLPLLLLQPGLVVKWLSRLPVTEEIAGSSPVGPANSDFGLKQTTNQVVS